jgi:hypothetical protein
MCHPVRRRRICCVKNADADQGGRAVSGLCLQPAIFWECGFKSRRGVVCSQIEFSAF